MSKKEAAFHAGRMPGASASTSRRIMRVLELLSKTGMSRTSIWRAVRAGSFPAPIQLGQNMVGWFEDEIDEYLATRPRVPYAPAENKLAELCEVSEHAPLGHNRPEADATPRRRTHGGKGPAP